MKLGELLLPLLICWGLPATTVAATPASLSELLEQVRRSQLQQEVTNSQREQRFLAEKDAQEQRLHSLQEALEAEQRRSAQLQQTFDQNEETIASLESQLQARSGALLELFGVYREVAGDTAALFKDSLISTQIPGRVQQVEQLATHDSMPSTQQLEALWFVLQQEMTESGRVVRYPALVIGTDGSETEQPVTRVGAFNAVSSGRFLRYLPDNGTLQELPRQPAARYSELAASLEKATTGMHSMVIDPSRGSVFSLLLQTPDLIERIRQGKLVGYVIIAVGVVGLLIALERLSHLFFVGRKVRQQLKSESPERDNPLGRVMAIYRENTGLSPDTLELKMDESILKDSSRLQRGLSSLKILAAIAPLLGLLGTVTGLIETFQSITLFGAGDPGLMAGGISQALVTTVLGLSTAIPLILMHSMLASRSRQMVSLLEEQSAGIIALHAEKSEQHVSLA
jgi:biopolymer transport protein ExbB